MNNAIKLNEFRKELLEYNKTHTEETLVYEEEACLEITYRDLLGEKQSLYYLINKYKVEMIDEIVAKSILQTKNELIDLDYCIDFNTNEEITVEELIQKIKEISKYKEHKLVENKEKGVWSKLEKETIEMLIYVASISFQVAGALVLLLFSLSTKRQEVIKRFSGTGIIFRDGNTKELTYNEKEFKNTFRSGYLNKCALGYITIGYFGGVFGSIGEYNKVFVGLMIILVTIFLLIISIDFVEWILEKSKVVNKKITNEELEEAGIEPDEESISNEEIDKMFEECINDIKNEV